MTFTFYSITFIHNLIKYKISLKHLIKKINPLNNFKYDHYPM